MVIIQLIVQHDSRLCLIIYLFIYLPINQDLVTHCSVHYVSENANEYPPVFTWAQLKPLHVVFCSTMVQNPMHYIYNYTKTENFESWNQALLKVFHSERPYFTSSYTHNQCMNLWISTAQLSFIKRAFLLNFRFSCLKQTPTSIQPWTGWLRAPRRLRRLLQSAVPGSAPAWALKPESDPAPQCLHLTHGCQSLVYFNIQDYFICPEGNFSWTNRLTHKNTYDTVQ